MENEQIDILNIIKDPQLKKAVEDKMRSIKVVYYNPGIYKRTPLYNLVESNNYNANFFIDEFLKITTKECKLPKGQRDIIVSVVGEAMHYVWLKNKRNGNKEKGGSESSDTK